MHPNDTLNGKLVNSEWEREDEKHLRHKVGYWRMVEHRMIRAQIIAEGKDPDSMEMAFEVSRRSAEIHKNDPSLREQQAARRLVIAGVEIKLPETPVFTKEELEHIAQHFGGANDPLAASIFEKAQRAAGGME